MAGAVELDANRIRPVTDIAKKVGERADGSPIMQAGPDATGYELGQIVPNDYASKARALRRSANMTKNIMREYNEGGGATEAEARDIQAEIRERLRQAETEEERRDIWREYVNS